MLNKKIVAMLFIFFTNGINAFPRINVGCKVRPKKENSIKIKSIRKRPTTPPAQPRQPRQQNIYNKTNIIIAALLTPTIICVAGTLIRDFMLQEN